MTTPPNLRIAVLLLPDDQNLDVVGTMDYLNNHSQAYLAKFPAVQHLLAKAPILTWYFVSDNLDPINGQLGPVRSMPCGLYPLLAQTGVLDGYHVASNRMALKFAVDAGKLNKAVHWVGDARWDQDGRVWSAAGVTAEIDLAAEFERTFFDLEAAEFAKVISEVVHSDRPDPYAWVLEGVDLGAGK
ncbi:hypothetical protein K443DRAFT_4169 [Laccaria amethystina LaAM-08-1]|uniref:Uncharacterized protein n=1 Tax=Laccaria amethystina LaAM-08-1 TaxID=1095629 RepID=A0A0C9WYW3_9AGAR|nr:hypothetical protein K443DRAFT_4169 [Laccaria amethystina LaAM-08-1]